MAVDMETGKNCTTMSSFYVCSGQMINVTANTDNFRTALKEAAKKLKLFAKKLDKQKDKKPVDFNKFLKTLCLCHRRKKC